VRTTTFRWTLVVSAAFTVCILLMFAFVLAQAYRIMTSDIDRLVTSATEVVAAATTPEELLQRMDEHLRVNPRGAKFGGLFAADGRRIAGNIATLPHELKPDMAPQLVMVQATGASGGNQHTMRAVAQKLPDGGTLVIGRSDYEFTWIVHTVERALLLGLIPTLCLAFAVGLFLNGLAQRRVEEVNQTVQRFVAGELHERLPTPGTNDPFGRLAGLVNGILDEVESLVRRLAGVGDDIAHDLRTPLTRVRVSLERARQKAGSLDELRGSVDQAIVGLDQSLAIITALLRIAEIEHSRRMDSFRDVALAELVREVGDLYEPIAEDKKVTFAVNATDDAVVHGDRDLLFEAVANMVDNAVKFTPAGGRVEISLIRRGDDAVVRVSDSGPGIAAGEVDLVAKRFYRSDKSRRDPGLGLGLSLVAAIVKLHGFRFNISAGPGCVAEISGHRIAAA
jgi:signal transduction histidine kinase